VTYLLKAGTVEAEKQPLLGNARTQQYRMCHDTWRVQPFLWSNSIKAFPLKRMQAIIVELCFLCCYFRRLIKWTRKVVKSVELRSWQLQQRIERVFGVGSWQNNWEEIARKELGCAKKTYVCCRCSETGISTVLKSVARIRLVIYRGHCCL
jgi:hypothetical protein